ncbi:MFS transporter [Brumimicrobium salinarum]|uniref:MFS transporter n=1 Tax=Brumimicrobium salinarum TaxID=2058658 RepID=A0A2I0R212_9FLAO|nr:MFS transporter [Brumimicrobium salinarum]PKR80628.1 MFS transporter [Brumimicrobium salinarum]
MNKGLIALAFGGLALGMTEFNMMGLILEIANDVQISIPEAGNLIAIYALGVVIGAPTLVVLTANMPPKRVLFYLMLLFSVFTIVFSLSPSPLGLYVSRFISGLPHGAFFGVGSVVAAQLAKPGKEAQAISIMFTGMTIANLAGIPLGTYLGQHFSWRLTYILISGLGLVTAISIYYWLPTIEKPNVNVKKQLNYFSRKEAWLIIAVIAIGTGGLFSWMSYIAPLVTKVSGVEEKNVPIIMFLVGSGMFIGNLIGGKLADTVIPTKAAMYSFLAMTICLLVNYFVSGVTWAAYPMAFITGAVAFSIGASLQMMLINSAEGAETIAASAGQGAFNIGNSLGAYFGAIPIGLGFAYNTPTLVGAVLAFSGSLLALLYLLKYRIRQVKKNAAA